MSKNRDIPNKNGGFKEDPKTDKKDVMPPLPATTIRELHMSYSESMKYYQIKIDELRDRCQHESIYLAELENQFYEGKLVSIDAVNRCTSCGKIVK
jgi:hypothetical protein